MNHKQYEDLDLNDPEIKARLQNTPEEKIISSKKDFDALRKKNPNIPAWMWPQNRAGANDPDHVADIAKDMQKRLASGNPIPQKTPMSCYDIREMFDIAPEDPSIIGGDGGHRLAAIRSLGWQMARVYMSDPPKNIFEAYGDQINANNHGEISKSNSFETLQAKFNDFVELVRSKGITKKECEKSESLIGKLIFKFEDNMRGKDPKARRAAKAAMKAALVNEWGMHKVDVVMLLDACITYENSEVSYNAEVATNLEVLQLGQAKGEKIIGYRLNADEEVQEIIASVAHADHVRNAFHKLEDIDMEANGVGGLPLAANVEYSFALGYKFRQSDIGKNPSGVVTVQRSKFINILNKKLAYRGSGLKIKIGKVYFPDQIKNKECGVLKLSTNAKGLFPVTKKGVYDSKNLEDPKITYKGW